MVALLETRMRRGAFVDGDHRYRLWRSWQSGARSVCFVMLNPSTADSETDDPTVRKCVGFAHRWGFKSIDVVNLYSFRATNPAELRSAPALNGPYATSTIIGVLREYVDRVVFAWGTKGDAKRAAQIDRLVRCEGFEPECLRLTRDGHPWHPLYVPYDVEPIAFPGVVA